MRKKLIFIALLLLAPALHAAFTPGRYEIQDLGGNAIGTLAVSVKESSYENKPATRINWEFIYSRDPFKSEERHEAYIGKSGLVFFRKEVKDDKGVALTQGHLQNGTLVVWIDDHGRKISTNASQKDFQVSEYNLETPDSPFWDMKLKDAKSAGVFSVREMKAVSARRNINALAQFPHDGKFIPTWAVNTSFSNSVVTSWFTVNSHVLMKERWPDRQFIRVGD